MSGCKVPNPSKVCQSFSVAEPVYHGLRKKLFDPTLLDHGYVLDEHFHIKYVLKP